MNPVNAYKETQIKTASQSKLVVMLYDEAVRQLDQASESINAGVKQYDQVNNSINRTQDIITELMASLDFEKGGEISKNLFSLYIFFNQQLMQANMKKDREQLQAVRRMLAELRDAWKVAFNKVGSSSLTQPSEGGSINIAG